MNLQEDVRIVRRNAVEGQVGTPLGEVFDGYINHYGIHNIHFICALVYSLGKMHGKREERARRKPHER